VALFEEHIPYSARNHASYGHAPVAVFHLAVSHDDVFTRDTHAPAVAVASGVDGDAVVARVERTILNEHILGRVRIAAVVIRSMTHDLDAANRDVGAEDGIDLPHRRVRDRYSFDQDIAGPAGLNEVRAQIAAFA